MKKISKSEIACMDGVVISDHIYARKDFYFYFFNSAE